MARGKRSYTLEEQLEKIISEIEEMEVSLKELKKEKKELEEQVKMNRLAQLDEMISSSGKSFDDVKEFLTNAQ